jgi:Ca-activated chloride channel family protein
MFGSLLRSSPHTKQINWNDIIGLAESSAVYNNNNLLQKEFVTLLQQARTLYTKYKKKKGGVAVN